MFNKFKLSNSTRSVITIFIVAFYILQPIKADANLVTIEHADLIYLETSEGLVIVELAPFFSPNHVNQFKNLVNEGFYNNLDFYRVIDGFVAQGGDSSETKSSSFDSPLKAEFTRAITAESAFITVQSPEFLASETGFINGFPAARSQNEKIEWLIHCPGAVAMARSTEPDSATTDFYIVIGQAPRHLDRNMSIFGQVVFGLNHVQSFQRGDRNINSGVIQNQEKRSKIISARLGEQVPANQRYLIQRYATDSQESKEKFENARNLSSDFFQYKGSGNVDVCYYKPDIKVTAPVSN